MVRRNITGMRWHDAAGNSSPVLKRAYVPVEDLVDVAPWNCSWPRVRTRPLGPLRKTDLILNGILRFVAVPSITAPRTFQADSAIVTLTHLSELQKSTSSDGGGHWQRGHHLDRQGNHRPVGARHSE